MKIRKIFEPDTMKIGRIRERQRIIEIIRKRGQDENFMIEDLLEDIIKEIIS